MQKRDPIKEQYEVYEIPRNRHCPLIARLDEPINCTGCGKDSTYGTCFTSRQIHTDTGFGYPVCDDCYKKERDQ